METQCNITPQGTDKSPVLTDEDEIAAFAQAQGLPTERVKLVDREQFERDAFLTKAHATYASGSEFKSDDELLRLWEEHRRLTYKPCQAKIFVVT